MDKRLQLLYIIPLGLAFITFFVTQQILFTGLAFAVGLLILQLLRRRLMPPFVDKAVRLYQAGKLDEAQDFAGRAIAARPERWEAYYVRALINYTRPDHAAAEADARQAIALRPQEASTHAILGQVLYWQTRYSEAKEAFSEAARLNGKDALNHFYLGASLYQLGEMAPAIPRLELTVKLKLPNPQLDLLAHYYLGAALMAEGHEEDAQIIFGQMRKMSKALTALKDDLQRAPITPGLPRLRQDVADLEKQLAQMPQPA